MNKNSNLFRIVIIAFIGIWGADLANAQSNNPSDNSPYSRFGLGNLVSTDFGALDGMGGIAAAYNANNALNISNPASLGFLNTTSFEAGLFSKMSWLESGNENAFFADGNLTHLALGFPLQNPINQITKVKKSPWHWSAAFGLLPYSRVNYEVQTETVLENIDTVAYQFSGTGGLYQLFLSNGIRHNDFSFGFTVGYVFGQISQNRISFFRDIDNSFSNILDDDINHSGFIWNLGVQQRIPLKNQVNLTLGATFNSNMNISARSQSLNRRFNTFYGYDTIAANSSSQSTVTLPLEFSLGATLSKDRKWLLGVDYSATQWANYNHPLKQETLSNAYRVGLGGGYTPDYNAVNRYFKKVTYRAGAFYQLDPRSSDGEQLNQYGVNLGMGLPIILPKKGKVGDANLSIEAGRFAYASSISEQYLVFKAAFSFNDNSWFYKREFK